MGPDGRIQGKENRPPAGEKMAIITLTPSGPPSGDYGPPNSKQQQQQQQAMQYQGDNQIQMQIQRTPPHRPPPPRPTRTPPTLHMGQAAATSGTGQQRHEMIPASTTGADPQWQIERAAAAAASAVNQRQRTSHPHTQQQHGTMATSYDRAVQQHPQGGRSLNPSWHINGTAQMQMPMPPPRASPHASPYASPYSSPSHQRRTVQPGSVLPHPHHHHGQQQQAPLQRTPPPPPPHRSAQISMLKAAAMELERTNSLGQNAYIGTAARGPRGGGHGGGQQSPQRRQQRSPGGRSRSNSFQRETAGPSPQSAWDEAWDDAVRRSHGDGGPRDGDVRRSHSDDPYLRSRSAGSHGRRGSRSPARRAGTLGRSLTDGTERYRGATAAGILPSGRSPGGRPRSGSLSRPDRADHHGWALTAGGDGGPSGRSPGGNGDGSGRSHSRSPGGPGAGRSHSRSPGNGGRGRGGSDPGSPERRPGPPPFARGGSGAGGGGGDGDDDNGDDESVQSGASSITTREDGDAEPDRAHPLVRAVRCAVCGLLPKVEPIPPATFLLLSVWTAVPPVAYILCFTRMGYGETIFYGLADRASPGAAAALGLGLTVLVLVLYLLDADGWAGGAGGLALDLSMLTVVVGLVLLVMLMAHEYPYGIVCLFAIFMPLWLLALKLLKYDKVDTRTFVSWLSGPLLLLSLLIGLSWTAWVFSDPDNEWNVVAGVSAAERTGCEADYTDHPDCGDGSGGTCFSVVREGDEEYLLFPEGCSSNCVEVYAECSAGFILWVGPVLVGLAALFLSFFCTFLRSEGAKDKDVLNFGAVWILILFGMWVTTSLAGAAGGIILALAALTLASFVASAVFFVVSTSSEERSRNAEQVMDRVRKKYGDHLDWARGLFVVTCLPIVAVYLVLSMANQLVRRSGLFPCSAPPGDGPGSGGVFTARTKKQVDAMRSWNRSRVFTYAIIWGIGFMILQVIVANLTVVFLSWMIEKTRPYGIGVVTAIMIGVGVAMFLLPPVPGVPVYLSLGIVLPAQGHELMGWTGSIFYSVAIGLMLKLGASAMQQKLVGERLSHIVKVRQFVGINSRFIKAMRLVLEKDGLDLAKVCILIGGPDWPTSVLCGILRLPLLQIMLGTAPIVFLIMPTCMSGAFLYMAFLETDGNPDFPWSATVSTITLTLTAIVQFGSMIVAAYYVERASANSDDIAAIPDDLEVKEVDDEEEHLRRCYQTATQWEAMPWLPKISLGASLVFIVTSSYMVQLFSSYCFTPHTLTDSIAENLDGKVSNLFLPLGWVSVALFGVSCTLLFLFMTWGEKKALQLVNESRGSSRVAPDDIQVSAEGTEVRLHSYGLSSLSFDAFHNVDS